MFLKFKLLLLSTILFFTMCKVNNAQDQLNPEHIVDANFTNWFGGRDGVRGINYEIYIITNKKLKIENVVINNVKQNFQIKMLDNGIKINIYNTSTQHSPMIGQENIETPFEVYDPNLHAYIEYQLENTSKIQTIKLPKFTQKNTPLIP